MDLAALDRRVAPKAAPDRLGERLRAVDDEQTRHCWIEASLDQASSPQAHRDRSNLRSGPTGQPVRLPTGEGRQDGYTPGVLAHHARRKARRGGRRFARLLHVYSASTTCEMPDAPHRRWSTPPCYQKLANSDGGGTSRAPNDTDSGGAEGQERNPARLTIEPAAGKSLFPTLRVGL